MTLDEIIRHYKGEVDKPKLLHQDTAAILTLAKEIKAIKERLDELEPLPLEVVPRVEEEKP